jgi:hypothetical protein
VETDKSTEDDLQIQEDQFIEDLQLLLEEMQCFGYEGARGVEDRLCDVCDQILSRLPEITLLDTVPWCRLRMRIPQGLMVQRRYGEGALEAEAEEKSKLQLRKTFEEFAKKAQQVKKQRRKAEFFLVCYGAW